MDHTNVTFDGTAWQPKTALRDCSPQAPQRTREHYKNVGPVQPDHCRGPASLVTDYTRTTASLLKRSRITDSARRSLDHCSVSPPKAPNKLQYQDADDRSGMHLANRMAKQRPHGHS